MFQHAGVSQVSYKQHGVATPLVIQRSPSRLGTATARDVRVQHAALSGGRSPHAHRPSEGNAEVTEQNCSPTRCKVWKSARGRVRRAGAASGHEPLRQPARRAYRPVPNTNCSLRPLASEAQQLLVAGSFTQLFRERPPQETLPHAGAARTTAATPSGSAPPRSPQAALGWAPPG